MSSDRYDNGYYVSSIAVAFSPKLLTGHDGLGY